MPESYYVSQYSGEEIDALLGGAGTGTVRYDAAQTLTDAQKAQARGNINAAPDGFGYGGALDTVSGATDEAFLAAVESKLTTMPPTGAMQINWGSYPALDGLSRVGTLAKHGDQYASLTGYSYGGTAITRCKNAGTWGAWEWVNPPMLLGVEYRTTERYLGKPVYCQLVNFGALPNATQKGVKHNIPNVSSVISVYGSAQDQAIVVGAFGAQVTGINADNTNVAIWTSADLSNYSAYVAMKYTKTTD